MHALPSDPPRAPARRLPRHACAACALVLASAFGGTSWAQAGSGCGDPFVAFGSAEPLDYRTAPESRRKLVETYHFTPRVQALIKGQSGAYVGADLDFTLKAFPNHHPALAAMSALAARARTPQPIGAGYPVECYFQRAMTFRPDDSIVRMLYAQYLGQAGRKDDARRQLGFLTEQAGDNGFTQYNAGLVYLELGDYDRALSQAHRALALHFDGTALKERLQAAGKWVAPPASAETAASGAAAGTAPMASPASPPASAPTAASARGG